ncbi:hypothetical protein HNP81_003915 [Peribacillus huizhouensis]|uniref:HNH endonuclease n=1 Tax=Peribacillus huizhouensis TaxID=1501239 RepID=A0ABR6CUF8_9BACI|nr:hypothetical protein [Peribacillus huizhouensis]
MIKSKQLERPSLVHKGIWTPWAELLCYECHGRNFSSGQLNDCHDR